MLLRFQDLSAFLVVLAYLPLVFLLRSGRLDEIAKYTVTNPELIDPTLVARSSPPAVAATEQQTIGLIIPVGESSWFFKLTGAKEAVQPQHEAFLQFITSIKFSTGPEAKPSWTLLEGWRQLPGGEFRYATIQLSQTDSGSKPLEISVSTAGGDVLANVNRWRGQLNLKPIGAEDLASTTKTLTIDGHEAMLVSLIGTISGGMRAAPFAPF